MPTKVIRVVDEPGRHVVNHAGRGDNRPAVTKLEDSLYALPMEKLRPTADAKLKVDRWQKTLGPQVDERVSAVLKHYIPMGYRDTVKNGNLIAAKLSSPEAIQERRRQHREDNDYSLMEIAVAVEGLFSGGEFDIDQAKASEQRVEEYSEQLANLPRNEDDLYNVGRGKLRGARGYDPLGPPQE